ncbi:hypothetical protein ACHAWO_001837 [Cyclotella atomus]|uniref:DDE Tnp4 domain-containing protein n=1 Tax=Cyclotella atomus TaxID=382360 RepID=A0ABD3Q5B6_9STRA
MDPPDATDDAATAAAAASAAAGATAGAKRSRTTEPSSADFYVIGRDIQNRSNHRVSSDLSEDQRFREYFGCSAEIALIVWNLLIQYELLPDEAQIAHHLWALFFMKIYAKEKVTCGAVGGQGGAIDPKTLRKYIWPMIKAIAGLEPYKILFENRFMNDKHNDCLMTVDCTDVRIPERGKKFFSFKFKKSAFRYEVACAILGNAICWVSGPHPAGRMGDLEIFRTGLLHHLDEEERVEADDGYEGEAPLYVCCPGSVTMQDERKKIAGRARSRQETINKRLKQWEILRATFRHDLLHHRDVFVAIVCITQVAIENGEPLFDCNEYEY